MDLLFAHLMGVRQDLLWFEAAGHLCVSPADGTEWLGTFTDRNIEIPASSLSLLPSVGPLLPSVPPSSSHQFHSSSSFMCPALSVMLCISFLSFILITSLLLFPASVAAGIILFQSEVQAAVIGTSSTVNCRLTLCMEVTRLSCLTVTPEASQASSVGNHWRMTFFHKMLKELLPFLAGYKHPIFLNVTCSERLGIAHINITVHVCVWCMCVSCMCVHFGQWMTQICACSAPRGFHSSDAQRKSICLDLKARKTYDHIPLVACS